MLAKGFFKKSLQGAVAGVAVLALSAGMASAANIVLNVYGASAQFAFWNAAAGPFLTGKGCALVIPALSGSNGITTGTGPLVGGIPTDCTDGNQYKIRYSSKASYDGILALQNPVQVPAYASPVAPGTAIPAACQVDGITQVPAGDFSYRQMASTTAAPGTTCPVKVDIGASDVAGSAFLQASSGCSMSDHTANWANPPATNCSTPGQANYVSRNFKTIPGGPGLRTDNGGVPFGSANPLVVPFGVFANNCVTKTKCLAPDPTTPDYGSKVPGAVPEPLKDKAISSWGNSCYDPTNSGTSQDCVGYYKCVNNVCAGGVRKNQACDSVRNCPDVDVSATVCQRMPIDNVSRLQLSLIYSGNALNWQDFGAWFDGDCNLTTTADPIYACMRHAGSGTQATMDFYLRGGYPGTGIKMAEAESKTGPFYFFNDGTGDMMKCVNGNTLTATQGSNRGAIGYADCDILAQTPFASTSPLTRYPYERVHAVKLEGVECKAANIRNGEYPLYTKEWMYWTTTDANKLAAIASLVTFAANPDNYAFPENGYWVGALDANGNPDGEMLYMKSVDTDPNPTWTGTATYQRLP